MKDIFAVEYKKWTQEDFQYVIDNYGEKTYKEMAEHLGRTADAIRRKVYKERKKKKDEREVSNGE